MHQVKFDALTESGDAGGAGEHETPETPEPSSPISTSANTDIEWENNTDYFQTGKKAGTLKPRARAPGDTPKNKETTGLDFESLRSTQSVNPSEPVAVTIDKKKLKEEQKIVEAKIASKLVMRALDLITGWISGGTFGADFTEQQTKERNKYRAELESDWNDYLITLNIPLHPALVCVLGSVFYVAPAMETKRGQERVQTFKEKVMGKIGGALIKKMVGGNK